MPGDNKNFIKRSERELANAIRRAVKREEEANKRHKHIIRKQKESAENAD